MSLPQHRTEEVDSGPLFPSNVHRSKKHVERPEWVQKKRERDKLFEGICATARDLSSSKGYVELILTINISSKRKYWIYKSPACRHGTRTKPLVESREVEAG